jgi:hypothetical protein
VGTKGLFVMSMKKLLLVLLGISLASIFIVYQAVRRSTSEYATGVIDTATQISGCSTKAERSILFSSARLNSIRKLGEYEAMCGAQVTDTLFHTIELPTDPKLVPALLPQLVADLKEYQEYGLQPFVLVKLSSAWKETDFIDASKGKKNDVFTALVSGLEQQGITDEYIGAWVLFPDANLPLWQDKNVLPSQYVAIVNQMLTVLQKPFPNSARHLRLHTMTYETNDFEWSEQDFRSLSPYLTGITTNEIDALEFVAFPWMPPASKGGASLMKAAEYVPVTLMTEAMQVIQARQAWLITGTFAHLYGNEPENSITVPAPVRQELLTDTLSQMKKIQDRGYQVGVVLSNEDLRIKKDTSYWGYWGSDNTTNPAHKAAALNFVVGARQKGMLFGLL